MASKAGYTQLSDYQKFHIKEMLENGCSKVEIARKLSVHRSTIFNELKRGTIDGEYNPQYSIEKRNEKIVGGEEKSLIKENQRIAEYISGLILEQHLSPVNIIKYFKEHSTGFLKYPTSPATIYTAIDQGLIPNVTRDNLNANLNANITKVVSDTIRIPVAIRKKLDIQNGDRYKFECRKNGDIIMKKVKGNDMGE